MKFMAMKLTALVFIGLAVVTRWCAAGEGEEVVLMSPYEVSANSVDFRKWLKFETPHITLYTDADLNDAARIAGEFERLHLAAVRYLGRPSFKREPTIIVLPTSKSDWRKVESTAKFEWKVAVSQPTSRIAGLIVVQYDWQSFLRGGADTVFAALGKVEQHAMRLEGPLWFGQGMGRFFETAKFEDDTVILGKPNSRARRMRRKEWLAWPDFFKVTTSSKEFTTSDGVTIFSGQSAAFVHYLLTNPDPVWRDRLMQWALKQQSGVEPTEEEFAKVFGFTWDAWQKEMDEHVRDRSDMTATVRFTKEEAGFPRTKVNLEAREMRELFVLAQILNQRIPVSETALDLMLAKGLKTESLRGLLLEACMKWKRQDAAQEQARLLMKAGTPNPAVYAMAAENLFRSEVPAIRPRASVGDAAPEIRELCKKALAIEPRHPEASNLLAWTEALGPYVGPENVAAIEAISRTMSGIAPLQEIVGALAVAHWRTGNLKQARALAESLRDSPFANKKGKEVAMALLKELGPSP
jgi:hypothetical protein